MEFIGAWLIPIALAAAGLLMAVHETRTYLHPSELGPAPSLVRLVRLVVGCLTIVSIGGLIFDWLHYVKPALRPGVPPPMGLLGLLASLVVLMVLLAVWDAYDGVRGVRRMVEQMQRDDMTELHSLIEKAREKPH